MIRNHINYFNTMGTALLNEVACDVIQLGADQADVHPGIIRYGTANDLVEQHQGLIGLTSGHLKRKGAAPTQERLQLHNTGGISLPPMTTGIW